MQATAPAPIDDVQCEPRPPGARPRQALAVAPPSREGRRDEGHGRRLTSAFEALEAFPALAESRDRLVSVIVGNRLAVPDIVAVVESDVALVIAVLRLANQNQDRRGGIETAAEAVAALSPEGVLAFAHDLQTFDLFDGARIWDAAPGRFRLHALATQRAAERVAVEVGFEHRCRLMLTSLLHDIGKLVLIHAYPGYPHKVHGDARTPEERIHRERRELGVDHALVGGVLIRRWGLPASIATPIERHHNVDGEGEAVLLRLADMLAHYERGERVSLRSMLSCAESLGMSAAALKRVIYELPGAANPRRRRCARTCTTCTASSVRWIARRRC